MKPLALFLVASAAVMTGCASREQPPPEATVSVRVARAEVAEVRASVEAPATVWAREQANIASRITAPVRELRARKGDSVSREQVLAVLEDRDLIAQRQEAAAAVSDARATLQKISAGTLPSDVERARGQVAVAEAALRQARQIFERRQQLYKDGAIPHRELLVSETELAQATANYQVAKKALELLESQSREKDIRIAESRLAQAEAKLAYIEAQLAFTRIRSPFAGSVTEQFVYPGDMAKPDTPLFTVMDLSVMVARAQVPDSEAARVRAGQDCAFAALDRSDAPVGGRVTVVNRAVDPARRTVEVWCELRRPPAWLRAGAFGNAIMYVAPPRRSVVVPRSAVQFIEGTRRGSVLVLESGGVARKKDVETAVASGDSVPIVSGLRGGEMVITEGGYGLEDGARVRPERKHP